MAGEFPENGFCQRAREWSSLRVDGELSELETELLHRHLAGCPECAIFDSGVRTVARRLRATPAAAPSRPFEVPRLPRTVLPRRGVLAVAAVIMAAGVGALVGSGLERPAPPVTGPTGPQVSLLSRDLTQLRQLPRARQLPPQPSRSVPGGPSEHLI